MTKENVQKNMTTPINIATNTQNTGTIHDDWKQDDKLSCWPDSSRYVESM